MISFNELGYKEFELCFEIDSNTICLWTKKQWKFEFNKRGVKVFAILFGSEIIGICVLQIVIDEAQINYFLIKQKYRQKGYGTKLMNFLIRQCEKLNVKRILLEVSDKNSNAQVFYNKFKFLTVGRRENYYKDGSDAVLKEKFL